MSQARSIGAGLGADAGPADYLALLKPRVMSLVCFTGLVGMALAPGAGALHPTIAFTALLCIAVGAGAAGAINMWCDRDIIQPGGSVRDKEVIRTADERGLAMVFTGMRHFRH